MEYKEISILRQSMKEVLSQKRYEHSLGVAYTAANLASIYNEDINKAFIAGILHDCAKCYSQEENLKLCKEYNLELSELELSHTPLLHSKVGAYLAKTKYHVEDTDILNAIFYHTTGRPGMSNLEKIIYIADYIEPTRKEHPSLLQARKIAFTDLDKAMEMITESVLNYLYSLNIDVDVKTKETYEYYKDLKDGK